MLVGEVDSLIALLVARARGVRCLPEQIVITHGAHQALAVLGSKQPIERSHVDGRFPALGRLLALGDRDAHAG